MALDRPVVCPVLIARDDDVQALERCLDRVGPDRGQTVLIAGEAGVGKTRVVAELRRLAAGRGLAELRPAAGRTAGPGALTPREREIAALVGRGLSNPAIAAALVLSKRTVETHVANVMAKLEVASRAQIAAWAAEQGLLART